MNNNNNIQNNNNDKLQDWHDVHARSLLRMSDRHTQITNGYYDSANETPTTACVRRFQSAVSFRSPSVADIVAGNNNVQSTIQ